MRLQVRTVLAAVGAAVAVALGGAGATLPATATAQPAGSPETTTWLCQPGTPNDPCGGRADAPVDCFYVYPTASLQRTTNANFDRSPELIGTARMQAAPFAEHCNVWAPVYRQSTLQSLAGAPGPERTASLDFAYDDVESAWRDYLAHHNNGRGVILIGHSQGTRMLRNLIRNEIDGTPVQQQLVSALLIGGDVLVRKGQNVGGDFQYIPACEDTAQTGCVIAYSSYSEIPENPRYGRSPQTPGLSGTRGSLPYGPDYEVLCTNPASLGSTGAATVDGIGMRGRETTFTAQCTEGDDPRVLTISGPGARLLPALPDVGWGLHVLDITVAHRTLIDLVGTQTAAYIG
ncbi:MAG: DUF3089 domain-containing protein [Rhodococcus sp.]|nr:DUF3089 domain-containing protein [Rhodococcus sp. (in: high G+C Gram-positive bacteria)]